MQNMCDDWLKIQVSYFPNKTSQATQQMSLGDALSTIQSNRFEMLIAELRKFKAEGKQDKADAIKSNLPAVTFCATFYGRRISNQYAHYNNLLVIDIDKLSKEEMARVKECLINDPYVASFWKSPSGNGWKGLVQLSYSEEAQILEASDRHREAFLCVEQYFKTNYSIELDSSGKDITRLCFFSWDPELVIKGSSSAMSIEIEPKQTKPERKIVPQLIHSQSSQLIKDYAWNQVEGKSTQKNNPMERRLMENIYRYLVRHNSSITGSYEDWVKVAFAIAGTFHPAYGRTMFMKLCRLDGTGHNEEHSERLIYDAYTTMEKRSDFSTIIYLAGKKGYVR